MRFAKLRGHSLIRRREKDVVEEVKVNYRLI